MCSVFCLHPQPKPGDILMCQDVPSCINSYFNHRFALSMSHNISPSSRYVLLLITHELTVTWPGALWAGNKPQRLTQQWSGNPVFESWGISLWILEPIFGITSHLLLLHTIHIDFWTSHIQLANHHFGQQLPGFPLEKVRRWFFHMFICWRVTQTKES